MTAKTFSSIAAVIFTIVALAAAHPGRCPGGTSRSTRRRSRCGRAGSRASSPRRWRGWDLQCVTETPPSAPPTPTLRPRIYLAGPEVFFPNAKEQGAEKKRLCAEFGFEGVYPLDNVIDGAERHSPQELARLISHGNEQLMRSCDLLIANCTPFRSVSMDVGTAFEIGFMQALGGPCSAIRTHRPTMRAGCATPPASPVRYGTRRATRRTSRTSGWPRTS